MNAIKLFSLVLLSVVCITFSSCIDDTDYIVPQSGFTEPNVKVTTTIKDLKSLYKGKVVDFKEDNLVIEGYVVSSDEGGNIYKAIYIQDKPENPTAAIQLSVDAVGTYSSFDVGRKVYVKLNGLGLSDYNGTLQIGELKGTEVERISSTSYKDKILRSTKKEKIVPLKLEISKITDEHIGMLIEFEDMHSSVKGHTYAELNNSYGSTRIFKNCNGEKIGMRTSGFAKFKGHSIPDKKGSLISILTKYSKKYQLIIRDTEDVKFTEENDCTETGSKIVSELNEDFSSTVNYEDIDVTGWGIIASKGKRKWGGKESGGDLSAGISGYKYNGTVESWLITPGLDIANTANKTFSFDSQTALSRDETLEVLISTDYAGDPAKSNWTILSGVTLAPKNTVGSSAVVSSGIVNLSSYVGTVHIAFKYSGNGTDKTGTYLIDNVKFGIDKAVSLVSLEIDKTTISLDVNATDTVTVTGNGTYTITGNDTAIATASESNGIITVVGKTVGTTSILVTDTESKETKTISVEVNAANTPLSLNKNTVSLNVNATDNTVLITGNGIYTVTSNDTVIATVSESNGIITIVGKSAGTTSILVTDTTNNETKTISVEVNAANTPLFLNKNTISLNVNATDNTVLITGNGTYTVTSNDSGIATVSESNGTITIEGKAAGTTSILVTDTTNNETKTISVTVNAVITVVSLSLNKNTVSLNVNTTDNTVLITGNGTYTVTSNDSGIATVSESNGTIGIEGKAAGTTSIIVTDTANNETKTISVTVNAVSNVLTSNLFTGSDFEDWVAFEGGLYSSLSSYGVKSTAGKTGNALHINGNPTGYPFIFKAKTPNSFDLTGKTKINFYVKGTSVSKSIVINLYKSGGSYYKFNVKNLSTSDVVINPTSGTSYTGAIDTNNTWVKVTLDISGLTDVQTTAGEVLMGLKIAKPGNYDLLIDDITFE